MSEADVVVAVLWAAVTLYAVFAGADFGAGLWDLLAGDSDDGSRARARIELSLAPVWEANHVWLIFSLVVLWTAFSEAFSAVMSTLFVPLVPRRARDRAARVGLRLPQARPAAGAQRRYELLFAVSSILTPFFMGAVVGAVASGRVPADGDAHRCAAGRAGCFRNADLFASWTGATSLVVGALFVASCAFLAAVFLTADARRAGDDAVAAWFRVRALASGVVAGLLAGAGLVVLRADARPLFDGLLDEGLPLAALSVLCGAAALAALARDAPRAARVLAVGAVATVVWAWGAAQYPYLLPDSLTVSEAAAPDGTLRRAARCVRRGGAVRGARPGAAADPPPAQPAAGGAREPER